MKTMRHHLEPRIPNRIAAVMGRTLADLIALFRFITRARQRGHIPGFLSVDELASQIMGHIRRLREHAGELGNSLPGARRVGRFAYNFSRPEPATIHCADWLQELTERHSVASEHARLAVRKLIEAQDFGSADLLADVVRTLNLHQSLLMAHRKEMLLRN